MPFVNGITNSELQYFHSFYCGLNSLKAQLIFGNLSIKVMKSRVNGGSLVIFATWNNILYV